MISRTKRNRRKIRYHNPYILYGVLFMVLYFYLLGSSLYYLSLRRKRIVVISNNFYGDLILFSLLKGSVNYDDIVLLRHPRESVIYYNCIDDELRPLTGSVISRLGENIKVWRLTDNDLSAISYHTQISYDTLKKCHDDLFHNNGYIVYNLSECKRVIHPKITTSEKITVSRYNNMYFVSTDGGPMIADCVINTNTELNSGDIPVSYILGNYPTEIPKIKESIDADVCMINSDDAAECKADNLINFDNVNSINNEYPYKGSIEGNIVTVLSKEGGFIDNVYYKILSTMKIGSGDNSWFPKPSEEDRFRYSLSLPRPFGNVHPFHLPTTSDCITSVILVAKAIL